LPESRTPIGTRLSIRKRKEKKEREEKKYSQEIALLEHAKNGKPL